jgi:DNA-binding GntR family transcriptional regulator
MEQHNAKSLTEEAYQKKIKGFILRSEIYPLQKIIIEDLSKQMGIGRTPYLRSHEPPGQGGIVNHALGGIP